MTNSIEIRPARQRDAAAIAAILNHFVENGVETLQETPYTAEDISTRLQQFKQNGYGAFVADNGQVLGFSWYQQFRGVSGYRLSMEHSVYLSNEARGQGLGDSLYLAIENHAIDAGFHSFTGVITGSNASSITFHEKHGFVEAGRLAENGFKFDAFHDVVFLYKILQSAVANPTVSS